MKRFIPLAIFMVLAWGLAFALLQPKKAPVAQLTQLPALTLPALKGTQTLTLNAMQGDVSLINFFASWCTPCAAEMPEIAALKKQFPKVKFHGVVWNDTPETLQPWLKKNGNPFGALWLDEGGKAAVALGIRGIPETYIVDRHGNVIHHLAGPLNPDTKEAIIAALTRAEASDVAP